MPMNCPSCNRDFSFLYSFKILNALRHKCPSCGAVLTTGKRGKISNCMAGLLGLMIAAVAIVMEEKGLWTSHDSIIWFAIAFIIFIPPFQYISWRWCRFQISKEQQKGRSRIGKFILVFLALFASWIAFVLLHDETLDPDFNEFYLENGCVIPDNENVAIGLAGLDAPAGTNFIDVGTVAFHAEKMNMYSGRKERQTDVQTKRKLSFDGNDEELNCWIWSDDLAKSSPQ